MSSFLLLFIFALIYVQEFFKAFNIPADVISVAFALYNFGVIGRCSNEEWRARDRVRRVDFMRY